MRKEFLVKIYAIETMPFENGLVGELVNKNHIMYVAQHQLESRVYPFTSAKAGYEIWLREYKMVDGVERLEKETKLTP